MSKFRRIACARTCGSLAGVALLFCGCSVRQMAVKQLGTALAESAGRAFAAEADVEFAGQAVPFSLKLIETLLVEQPDNPDLLAAAAGGFAQYAYVWVQLPADLTEEEDFAEAQRQRGRARAFYLRAFAYAMRGLEAGHPGIRELLATGQARALASLTTADLPALYWSAASLGGAISLGKTEPELIARQSQFAALLDRAYVLNPDWQGGAVRELMMIYQLSRPNGGEEALRQARTEFDRIVEMGNGLRASPFVSYAESVCVSQQDKPKFLELLQRALAIDVDRDPAHRLANVVAQKRARWLLDRVDELFLE